MVNPPRPSVDERVRELEKLLREARVAIDDPIDCSCATCMDVAALLERIDAALSGAPREQESTDQEAPEARGPVGPPLDAGHSAECDAEYESLLGNGQELPMPPRICICSPAAAAAPEAGPWKCDGCGGRMWANPAQWPKHIIVELGGNRVCGNVVSAAPSPHPPEPEGREPLGWVLCSGCGHCNTVMPKDLVPFAPEGPPDPAPAAASAGLAQDIEKLRAEKNGAYAERNKLVVLVARMAIALGWRAGVGTHEDKPGEAWEPDWRSIVCIDLPTGQASWHFHDSEKALLANLPRYAEGWDGHDTEEKYRRVLALACSPLPEKPSARAASAGLCEICRRRVWTAIIALAGDISPHNCCHARHDGTDSYNNAECYRLGYERLRAASAGEGALRLEALETVLEFARKWAESKRRDREALEEAEPILRAALAPAQRETEKEQK